MNRKEQLSLSLLHRIETAGEHGYSIPAFVDSYRVRFETVEGLLLDLENSGKIRRTGTTQSIITKNRIVTLPKYEVAR